MSRCAPGQVGRAKDSIPDDRGISLLKTVVDTGVPVLVSFATGVGRELAADECRRVARQPRIVAAHRGAGHLAARRRLGFGPFSQPSTRYHVWCLAGRGVPERRQWERMLRPGLC